MVDECFRPCSTRASSLCRLLLETARGLSHMHARGKVHRDVKPGNIVVVGGDDETAPLTAKVADFGMACGEKRQISPFAERIGTVWELSFPLVGSRLLWHP